MRGVLLLLYLPRPAKTGPCSFAFLFAVHDLGREVSVFRLGRDPFGFKLCQSIFKPALSVRDPRESVGKAHQLLMHRGIV